MTGKDRQDNDLRHLVGMHVFECPDHLIHEAPPRLMMSRCSSSSQDTPFHRYRDRIGVMLTQATRFFSEGAVPGPLNGTAALLNTERRSPVHLPHFSSP